MTKTFDINGNIERTIVSLLTISEIRYRVKDYIEPWFFENDLMRKLATVLIEKFPDREVNKSLLLITITNKYKDLEESDLSVVVSILEEAESLNSSVDIKQALSVISDFIKNAYRAKAVEFYEIGEGDRGDYYSSKAMSFGIEDDFILDPSNPDVLQRIINEDFPNKEEENIRSSMECINSCLIYNSYKPGDLVMVCAAPKSGKTSFLIQEGSNFIKSGIKVLHIMIGDMSNLDTVIRYLSSSCAIPQKDILQMIKQKSFENLVYDNKSQLSNLRIASIPALSRNIYEILFEARKIKKEFDYKVIILDYDSNILVPRAENLYESGGVLYSTLKGFAQKERVLVMVASQPKIQYWDQEVLSGSAASESSRKQAAVDIMITLGRNKKCRKVGTIYIPFVRRGESGVVRRIRFEDHICRMYEIENEVYKKMIDKYVDDSCLDDCYIDVMLSEELSAGDRRRSS